MTENDVIDIIKNILPAAIVLLTTFFLVKRFLDQDQQKRMLELKREMSKDLIPIRLQAYERITIMLERISPNNLIIRVRDKNMNVRMLQEELLKHIRMEFDHNISQQIYMSTQTWDMVKTAKEAMIKLVNTAATRIHSESQGVELSKTILQMAAEAKDLPTNVAIAHLKEEVKTLFK